MNSATRNFRIAVASVFLMVGGFAWWLHSRLKLEVHHHCIRAVGTWLGEYAESNGGKFPTSDRGWADALLELSKIEGNDSWIPYFTGVDDHGELFKRALMDHSDIPESKCTRIYVQGLNEKSDPDIAIVFDRFSIQGGDHWRGDFSQPRMREASLLCGSMEIIKDADWPAFEKRQRELLELAGLSKEQIEGIYSLTGTPHD